MQQKCHNKLNGIVMTCLKLVYTINRVQATVW